MRRPWNAFPAMVDYTNVHIRVYYQWVRSVSRANLTKENYNRVFVDPLRANTMLTQLLNAGPWDGTETHFQLVEFQTMHIWVYYPWVQSVTRAESTIKNFICLSAHPLHANAMLTQLFNAGPWKGTETHGGLSKNVHTGILSMGSKCQSSQFDHGELQSCVCGSAARKCY